MLARREFLTHAAAAGTLALNSTLVEAATMDRSTLHGLASPDQKRVERNVLRILDGRELVEARAIARAIMVNHRVGQTPEGAALIDHTLDNWMVMQALQVALHGLRPAIAWNAYLSPIDMFGFRFPAASGAFDDPNTVYRGAALDGTGRYLLKGRLTQRPAATLSFQLGPNRRGQGFAVVQGRKSGDRAAVFKTLLDHDMDIADDGSFIITLDNSTGNGRRNHFQLPEADLSLVMRDTLSDWDQLPVELSLEQVGGPAAQAPPVAEQARYVAANLPGYVRSWLDFMATYEDNPPLNTANQPFVGTGARHVASVIHFRLRDDQAMVVTMEDADAAYIGIQATDAWMGPLTPTRYLGSYNRAQTLRDADGLYTYVVSPRDPHLPNWVETAGQHEGYVYLRWQGQPKVDPANIHLIRKFEIVDLERLRATGNADLAAGRDAERERRARQWRHRMNPKANGAGASPVEGGSNGG